MNRTPAGPLLMEVSYTPGQRWVSISEPELGLGLIRAVGARTVTVAFPATQDVRQYAADHPPLRRAAFRQGDVIRTADGRELLVEDIREDEGLLHYSGGGLTVAETELSPTLSFSHPLSRLYAAAFDPPGAFELRRQALDAQYRWRQSPTRGFVGARITLLPHQIGIASAVASRLLPRVLLADEVGLGKTIEAALILHRLLLTGRVSRVLVLVPASLVHQWFIELLRRFNLWFSIFDEARCEAIEAARPEANVFLDSQLVVADLGWLTHAPGRLAQALEAGWDAVVVDEAHHLRWAHDRVSPEYAAVEALARRTPSLLLLTATPEQLGIASHFARLRLLDPDRFHDFDEFVRESAGYRKVAQLAEKLRERIPLSEDEWTHLGEWLGDSGLIRPCGHGDTPVDSNTAAVWIDALIDRHGTGRVMFRNTRMTVAGLPDRVPHLYPLDLPANRPDLAAALFREWRADRDDAADGRPPNFRADPRIEWLMALLRELGASEKVLVLCHTRSKVLAIEAALKERSASLKLTTFHEGLTLVQRDRGASWFADPDGARLLLCSEIGSEGRNFQFAHHLVLFDLPLDPALLEQRLGRLDRIGQTAQIHVHIPYVVGSHQEVLARWYQEGLDAFAGHLAGGRELLDRFGGRLRELGDQTHDRRRATPGALERLIADTREARHAIARQLEEGRDRLLEWQSFRPQLSAPLISLIQAEDADEALDGFVLAVLDLFMVQVEELAPRTFRLGSAGVLVDEFPGLPADGLTLTADRQRALVREDLQFMTWDHPLVTGAVDLLLGSEKGNCSVFRWIDDTRPTLYLEAIFVVECVAPAHLHVDRFLPPTPVAVIVDHRGGTCGRLVLPPAGSDPPHVAAGAALLTRDHIRDSVLPRMVDRATALARKEMPSLVAAARERMTARLDEEITRLLALRQINRSVRQEELDGLVEQRAALDTHLRGSRIRLDAVRLIDRGPRR